jgi:hypothetical protein
MECKDKELEAIEAKAAEQAHEIKKLKKKSRLQKWINLFLIWK